MNLFSQVFMTFIYSVIGNLVVPLLKFPQLQERITVAVLGEITKKKKKKKKKNRFIGKLNVNLWAKI